MLIDMWPIAWNSVGAKLDKTYAIAIPVIHGKCVNIMLICINWNVYSNL